jgi:enoyl-CoA hydratase
LDETAGADLEALKSGGMEFIEQVSEWTQSGFSKLSKPVIIAVKGAVIGGGCELVLMGDIVYCGESSIFAMPEVTHGTIPGCGGTQWLPAAIGKTRAMEMILSGGTITAQEAEKWGLVTRVFPDDEVLEQALKMAGKIAKHNPATVTMAKKAIKSYTTRSTEPGLKVEQELFYETFGLHVWKKQQAALAAITGTNGKNNNGNL